MKAVLLVALYVIAIGCSGGGVSQAEFDELENELYKIQKGMANLSKAISELQQPAAPTQKPPARPRIPDRPRQIQAPQEDLQQALGIVSRALGPNDLNIIPSDLRARKNPMGKGAMVFVPKTRFRGVDRYMIWVVVGGRAYASQRTDKEFDAGPAMAPGSAAGDVGCYRARSLSGYGQDQHRIWRTITTEDTPMTGITLEDLAQKIDGAEKRLGERIDGLDKKIDDKFDSLREEMNGKFAALTANLVQSGAVRRSA